MAMGDMVMKPVRVRTIAGSTLALLVVAAVQLLGPASAQATTMKEHSLGTGNGYHAITADPLTGDVYFGGFQTPSVDAVGRITPTGNVTWYPTGFIGVEGWPGNGMAMHGKDVWFGVVNTNWMGYLHFNGDGTTSVGHFLAAEAVYSLWTPDPANGTIYFAEGGHLGELAFAGPGDTAPTVTECSLSGTGLFASTITGDAVGNLYFTSGNSTISKIATPFGDGTCSGISTVSTPTQGAQVNGIAIGGDGRVWFGESHIAKVGAVNTDLSGIVEYNMGAGNPGSVAAGPDGNVYVTDVGFSRVLQVHPDGSFASFSTLSGNASPTTIIQGPDHAMWFPEISVHAMGQLVVTLPTKTTISSTANPATYGEQGDIVATVKSIPPGSIPTGDVQFFVNGNPFETDSLDAMGKARMPIADLEAGSYTIKASYLGTADFDASASKVLHQAVDPADTSVDLVSSKNPAQHGSPGAITATVNPVPPGGGTPTGTITFKVDGVARPPVTMANGKAKLKLRTLTRGSHVIVAVYSGSIDFNSSTSPPFTQVIT